MIRAYWKVLAVIGVLVTGGIYAVGGTASSMAISLTPEKESVVQAGAALYKTYCASCHGAKLEGQPDWKTRLANGRLPAPPHDKTGHTWHHKDALLFKITKLGTKEIAGADYETDMRGFGDDLTDQEIIAVLSFIKSTWPLNIQKSHDRMNNR